jgi:hypothetical protein
MQVPIGVWRAPLKNELLTFVGLEQCLYALLDLLIVLFEFRPVELLRDMRLGLILTSLGQIDHIWCV